MYEIVSFCCLEFISSVKHCITHRNLESSEVPLLLIFLPVSLIILILVFFPSHRVEDALEKLMVINGRQLTCPKDGADFHSGIKLSNFGSRKILLLPKMPNDSAKMLF